MRIKDGLSDWHLEHACNLLFTVLKKNQLESLLGEQFGVTTAQLKAAARNLRVFRTPTGRSFHQGHPGTPGTIAINFGAREEVENGGEYTEYPAYAADPIIGNRWVQNEDEHLIMTIGHELAHFVTGLAWRDERVKPHGDEFKRVYRFIRECSVNPLLDEFAQSAADRAHDQFQQRLRVKLNALRKMAEDETSNEHEAERALKQMQALMEKHGIENLADAETVGTRFIERQVPVLSEGNYKPLQHLFGGIARFCGVESVISSRPGAGYFHAASGKGSRKVVKYFGAPEDVEMAIYLSRIIVTVLFTETRAYRSSDAYRQELNRGVHAKTLIFAFRRAFVGRMCARLEAARTEVEGEWASQGDTAQALVTQRKAALRSSFQERYPRLGTLSISTSGKRNDSARKAGLSAADRVNLGRPVGRRGLKLLG